MAEKVSDEKPSPYTEVFQRPRSAASVTSGTNSNTPRPTSKSARSKSPKSSSRNKGKKKSKVDQNEIEIKKVSKEVKKKLELYINEEKRQTSFQPQGSIHTTKRMAPFDLAYKILENDKMEKASKYQKSNDKKQKRSKDPYVIEPRLKENSRRVTNYAEAERLSKYASEIFATYPVEKLAVIHRYKPHPKEQQKKGAENGDVLGYSGHVGAALHQKAYVDFYIKEGYNKTGKHSKTPVKKNEKKQSLDESFSSSSSSKEKNKQTAQNESKSHSKEEKVSNDDMTNESGQSKKHNSKSKAKKDKHNDKKSDTSSLKSSSSSSSYSSSDAGKHDDKDKYNGNDHHTKNNVESKQSQKDSDSQSLSNKSRESLNKTWEYYENSNGKETNDSSDEENKDKALSKDGKTKGPSSKHVEEDNKSLRSYVSVEHVKEV